MSIEPPAPVEVQRKRAAVYCRISRDREGDTLGVRRQERDCRDYAERMGWDVVAVYQDNDASAYDLRRRRSEYEAFVDAMVSGTFDVALATEPERFTRHPREVEDFVAAVEATLVEVAYVRAGRLDLRTPGGRFVARSLGAMARMESEEKSARLRSKHQELARRGRWKGGPRPYGYDIARDLEGRPLRDGRLYLVESEAEVIRAAARRVLAGETVYSVVADLNSRGVPTAQAAKWRTPTLRRILTAPTTYGHREHDGEDVGEASWPPILDRATVEQLQGIVFAPGRSRPSPARVALLAGGLGRCGRCGAHLFTQRRQTGTRVYVCSSAPDHGGCGRLSIVGDPTDTTVASAVVAALAGPGLTQALTKRSDDREAASERMAGDETLLSQLAIDMAERRITRAEWLVARDRIAARLEAERQKLTGDARSRVLRGLPTSRKRLAEAWESWSLDKRRAVVAAVVERVDVAPAVRRGPGFDAHRVVDGIVWRA